jgi:hypothetical protein
MYTKHCVKCQRVIKDEERICPYCGEYQPYETEETKENVKKREEDRREKKGLWIVFIINVIITLCLPLGIFWNRLILGLVFGFVEATITLFVIYYVKGDDEDKKN